MKLFEKFNLNNSNKIKSIKPFEINSIINNTVGANNSNKNDSTSNSHTILNKQKILCKNSRDLKNIVLKKSKSKEKENLEINNKTNKNLSTSHSNCKSDHNKNSKNILIKQNENDSNKHCDIVRNKNNDIMKLKNIKISRNNVNLLQNEAKKRENFISDYNNKKFYKTKNITSSLKYYINLSNNGNKIDKTNDLSNISNIKKHFAYKAINTDNINNNSLNYKSGTTNIVNTSPNNNNTHLNNIKINNAINKDKKLESIDKNIPSNDKIIKIIENNDKNEVDNKNNNNNIIININNENEKENEKDNKNNNVEIVNVLKCENLAKREKALYILITSPVLSLRSQLILSRGTNNIKKAISTEEILKNYKKHLSDKISDYQKKVVDYNSKITSHFTSSKIAEISLNFITNNCEIEFCEIYNSLLYSKEDEHFMYYKAYIKTIYYIINEKIEEVKKEDGNIEVNEQKLLINLFNILKKKGYYTIKDYLYYLFISSANKEKEKSFIKNMDKIDELITNEEPNLLNFSGLPKMCKFIQFSFYLIKEIIDFGNLIKDTTTLKIETENFLELLKNNLDKFRNKYSI